MKRVIVAALVLAVALGAAIVYKIRAQNEALRGPPTGSGTIETRGVSIATRQSGRVTKVFVEEGAVVKAGEALVEIECDEPLARLAEAEARLAAGQAQEVGAQAQASAAKKQSRAAKAAIGAATAQYAALSTQRDAADRQAGRLESMGEHASIADRDLARAQATGLEAQAQAVRASQAVSRGQAAAATAQAEAASAQARAASSNIEAMHALVRAATVRVAECRVTAPRAGRLERLYYEVGELVLPGSTVARVVDTEHVEVTFYLPNADLDEVAMGASVAIEADPYPGREFGGKVHRIGLEAEFTPRNIQTRSDRDRLVFPVEVRLPNEDGALRAGMPVTVTLVTDKAESR